MKARCNIEKDRSNHIRSCLKIAEKKSKKAGDNNSKIIKGQMSSEEKPTKQVQQTGKNFTEKSNLKDNVRYKKYLQLETSTFQNMRSSQSRRDTT